MRLFRHGGRWCSRCLGRKAENAVAGRWRRCGHDVGSIAALVLRIAVGALASGVPAFAASSDVGTAPRISRAAAARCEGQSLAATLAWVGRSDGVVGRPVPSDCHGGFRARRVLCWSGAMVVRTKMGPHSSNPFLVEVEKIGAGYVKTAAMPLVLAVVHTTISRTDRTVNPGEMLVDDGAEAARCPRSSP